ALAETVYTQPALFAVEWALAALWRSWGVEPAAVLGHSLGEYVAAAVAGVLSLADALRLVATRATAMQALPPGGAMEAVFADEPTVAAAIAKAGHGRVAIAAINGPAEVVISGAAEAVAAVADLLAARGHGRRRLNVAHAFHSPLIEPALAALERAAGEVALAVPRIPLVSNLTGRLARDELTRPAYYREHARAPVRFHDGLRTLHAQGIDLFLEIGPAPVLAGMGRRSLPDGAALFLASLRQNHDPWATLLTSLGALFVRGVRVDWSGLHRGEARRKLALPTYPFERTRCWTDLAPIAYPTTTTRSPQPTGLALRRLVSPALGDRRIIEATLAAELLPALRDHRVYDRLVVSGVVHLQLVAAAIADDPAAPPPLEFSAVRFAQPLLLPESGARLVQAIVRPDADAGALHFELASADATAPTRWTVHTTGRVRPLGPADVRPPARSLDLIRARCSEQRAGADFYAELWRPDEHHLGPSFRSIDHLWRRDGEALARLVLPPADLLAPDGSPADLAFARNACIGEVFGQALMPAVPDYDRLARDAHTTFIGHGVTASRDHEGAVQRARWCHAVLRESAPDHLVGDIALLDDTGVVISVVEGLRVQRVDRALVRQAFERMLRRADRPTVDPAALLAGDDPSARARLATYLAARVAAIAGVASTAVQTADSLRDLGLD
ncbi:MAG: acyltransferase domain-containing protein, partial [Myxococcales bacterium]|nr:acyltransferase domain-containing protein [Myxococcales bacterium]